MKPFDNSTIAHSIYKAKAIVVGDFFNNILRANSKASHSYLQEMRVASKQGEYALTPYNFLRKIASHTLLPNIPENKVDEIVGSNNFNVSVSIRSLDNIGHRKRQVSVLLSSPKNKDEFLMEFPTEGEYVGLSRSLFKKEDFSFLESLIISIDPIDMIYWKGREKKILESMKEQSYDRNSIIDALDDVLRRPGFEPGS